MDRQESDVFKDSIDDGVQESVLSSYDKDFVVEKKRVDLLGKITGVVGGLMTLYLIITNGWRAPEAFFQLSLFLMICLPLVFLLYPFFKKNVGKLPRWYDYILVLAVVFVCGYLLIYHRRITLGTGIANQFEQALFFVLLVCILEGVRRVAGWGLTLIITIFVLYGFIGHD